MDWDPARATQPADEAVSSQLRVTADRRVAVGRQAWLGSPFVLLCAAVVIAVQAALLAPGHTLAADIVSAVLVFALLNAGALASRAESRRAWVTASALQALAVVALVRVVGFGLPLRDGSAAVGTLVVAVLIGLVATGAAPRLRVPLRSLIAVRPTVAQACAAAAGLALGLAAYAVGAPSLWASGAKATAIVVVIVAVGAASVTEELLFRGVVQSTLQRSAGRSGLLAASALFAAMYLNLGAAILVMVVALAGLIFSYVVARTGNLTGALAGHVLFALGAGALWPVLLGRGHHHWLHGPGVTVAVAVALATMTLIVIRTAVD
jgi:membrane protease YdiL (CAAX protease family)